MKLKNFEKVGALVKERDYLRNLKISSQDTTRAVRIGGLDLRPDLAEKARPAMAAIFDAEILRVDTDLVNLGVKVEAGDVP